MCDGQTGGSQRVGICSTNTREESTKAEMSEERAEEDAIDGRNYG